ncbi:GNAT family N-acetyltransferase [Rhizobium sp. AAP43]|uniref:GNAT family N-acetyltransferase n=1 Tax=Rhizobium sp. AAP43 TaxID=1523420 RepID=UPI001FDA56B5|nr:GNAT family N-acetyltransferase [Rhizobium sp. AAP43]
MKPPPSRILTNRLVLRAARAEDAAVVFEDYTGDIKAAEFLPRGPHLSQSATEAVISAWGETNWNVSNRFVWTIIERRTDRPIGLFLLFNQNDEAAEIHYGLGPAFWGHGLATEAGSAVMRWIAEQSNLSEVRTICAADHDASCRVLEKIGLQRNQFIPAALQMRPTGVRSDGWSYIWRRDE